MKVSDKMAFDGSFTHSMVTELNNTITTGRVSKINQPYNNELVITVRAHGKNHQLLLSANPNYARVQITKIPNVNPAEPNNFTMVMRKYLNGAILQTVSQLDNDRVIKLTFTRRNELGDQTQLTLIVEIMARHSNIILVNQQNNKIIDAIKHVSGDMNRYRLILPGATYINPPKQDLVNPFSLTDFTPIAELVSQFPNVDVLAAELSKYLQGLSKDTALALATQLHQPNTVEDNFKTFINQFNNPQPTIAKNGSNKLIFTPFEFLNTTDSTHYSSLGELLDQFYEQKATIDRVQQQGAALIHVVKHQLKKNRLKLKKQTQELAATKNADEFRIKGEILTTYLYQINRGDSKVTLPNFYNNNEPIDISLSPEISPSKNAQKYFKKYQKLKNAVIYLDQQLKLTNKEIAYFENIQSQIELANPADLKDIKIELEQEGYLNANNFKRKKNKRSEKVSKPEQYLSSDGTTILVGKNNLQNDKLTMHDADKRETWLHTKNIPGSHVVIKSFNPSKTDIEEAAILAAYNSKAQKSTKVPVDYTLIKNVRKPNGAKPGLVIYDTNQTILVDPDKDIINKLKQTK